MFAYLYNFVRTRPAPSSYDAPTAPQKESGTQTAISPPERLRIKSIAIDAPIVPVGLTADRDMAIDDNPDTIAWYQFGPEPGQIGSAVLAGHYGWKDGHGSVFNNLHSLKVGDIISVEDQSGASLRFVVREVRTYSPESDATAVFKSTDAKAHLNLITCIGTWVNSTDSYSERLVVFADLE